MRETENIAGTLRHAPVIAFGEGFCVMNADDFMRHGGKPTRITGANLGEFDRVNATDDDGEFDL